MSDTNNNNSFDSLLTLQDAMKYPNVSRSMINRLLKRGELKGIKIGNVWRFQKKDIEEFINQKANNQ